MYITVDQFLNLFAAYNNSVCHAVHPCSSCTWIGLFCSKEMELSDTFITLTLSFFWLWIESYIISSYFTAINPAAYALPSWIFSRSGDLLLRFHEFITFFSISIESLCIYGVIMTLRMLIYPSLVIIWSCLSSVSHIRATLSTRYSHLECCS